MPADFPSLGVLTLVLLTTAAATAADASGGGDAVVMSVTWFIMVSSR